MSSASFNGQRHTDIIMLIALDLLFQDLNKSARVSKICLKTHFLKILLGKLKIEKTDQRTLKGVSSRV